MLTRSVQDADQNFSELLADVRRGETVLLTEGDRPVAEVRPVAHEPSSAEDRMSDSVWRAKHEQLIAMLSSKPDYGVRLGEITEEDKYGPSRW